MNLYYNGVDIYGDVSVNYCVHEMFAEKQADTLVIRFNDTKGTWSKWQPAEGDTVQFKEGASDTGKMFVHSMKPENGLFTIRAMSMPKSGKTKKSKSWEGVRFLQLANEFAGNHGLTFQNYGCADQVYPYIKQDNETDFALFHRLCALEGCQMLIFDGKLLAYNEQYIEGQTPAGSLSVDENGVFSYEDNRGGMYGSCEIASGSYSGKFIADSSNSSVLRPAVPIQVTHSIDRLTPHCVVGQLSAETIGACFPKGRDASCNYGIGYDGRVCLIVDECNRSWCSSSNANDQRAITIECASDKAEPYAMKSAVYEKLIKLCADICKRNGKTKVLWLGSKEEALAYEPKANEIVLTAHRWFANKSCPGDWLYSRYGELADRINALLGSTDSGNSGGNNTPSGGSGVKYYVQTGAYKQKANADAQLKKVKAAGFDAILKQSGGFYKVQTGAYSKKENADAEVKKLKAKDFDAIVTTDGGNAAGSASSEIKVGDVVQFSGGPHYGSAAASTAAGSPKAGPAKVTRIVKGAKHPYHIVHTDSQSNVYGWVDAANVSK